MKPDYLFVIVGAAVILYALTCAVRAFRHPSLKKSYVVLSLLWVVFGLGLLSQGFAPHLKIQRQAFRIDVNSSSAPITEDAKTLIDRERHMQVLSAILTVAGALGLSMFYLRAVPTLARRPSTLTAESQD